MSRQQIAKETAIKLSRPDLPASVIRWRSMMGYPLDRIRETTYPEVEQRPAPGTLTLKGVVK